MDSKTGAVNQPLMATTLADTLPTPSSGSSLQPQTSSSELAAPSVQATATNTGYQWNDKFFDDTDGIIAVFDFDYDLVESFQWELTTTSWMCLIATCLWPSTLLPASLFCYPCFAKQNIGWEARAQHVAVHRDGIKFVRDRRKAWCGLSCSDKGKNSKTVPFDKLTDCDVQEPAGMACCCFVPNVLSTVTVDTASSGGPSKEGIPQHELELRGLKDPHGFKKCVWDCKRNSVNLAGASDAASMNRESGTETTALLQEIRDELREQTKLLQAQQ